MGCFINPVNNKSNVFFKFSLTGLGWEVLQELVPKRLHDWPMSEKRSFVNETGFDGMISKTFCEIGYVKLEDVLSYVGSTPLTLETARERSRRFSVRWINLDTKEARYFLLRPYAAIVIQNILTPLPFDE